MPLHIIALTRLEKPCNAQSHINGNRKIKQSRTVVTRAWGWGKWGYFV